jgi:putative membrane protein
MTMFQSLAGLPAFLIYLIVASVLVGAYLLIYTWITHHNEFELVRANNTSAAISLGMSLIGFALPVTASIGHADSVIDLTIWGMVALVVQIAVYYLVRIPVPDLSQRIENGEIAPAIWLGTASVTAGMLNAASMST